ncbi:MAG: hypothetical protein ACTHJI_02565 [Leifsonia sp.]
MVLTIPDVDAGLTAVLRSLPASYMVVGEDQPTDIGVRHCDGTLLRPGTRGVLHVDPDPTTAMLRDESNVAMDAMWLEDPALLGAHEWFADALEGARFVQVDAVVRQASRRSRALVAVAVALGRVGGIGDVRVTALQPKATIMRMSASGVIVLVTVAVSDTVGGETASLRVVGTDSILRVELPDGASAAPASVARTTRAGTEIAPAIYESARRALLRRLHEAATEGGRLGDDYRKAARLIGDAGGLG